MAAGGAGAGGAWGGILGGVIGSGRDFGQFFAARELQNDAQDFVKFIMRNRHQLETRDLERAGLNRILSLVRPGNVPGGPGIASAPMRGMGGDIAAIANARQANATAIRQGAETELAQTANEVQQVKKEREELGRDLETMRLQWLRDNPAQFHSQMLGETSPANWPQMIQRILMDLGVVEGGKDAAGALADDPGVQSAAREISEFIEGKGKTPWYFSPGTRAYEELKEWWENRKREKK